MRNAGIFYFKGRTSGMAIHRTIKTKTSGRKWKSIDGETLKDRLSLDAYAILIYILGKSDDWEVYSGEIAAQFRASLNRVRKGLNELISKGYMTRVPRYENGKLKGWIYQVYEIPALAKTATLEPAYSASSHSGNDQLPSMDKRPSMEKRPNMKKSSYSEATTSPSASSDYEEFQFDGKKTPSPPPPEDTSSHPPEDLDALMDTPSPPNLAIPGRSTLDDFLIPYQPLYQEILCKEPPKISEHHWDILNWNKDRRERLQALTANPKRLRHMLLFCREYVPLEGHDRWGNGGDQSPYILTSDDCWNNFLIYEKARAAVREGKEPKQKDEQAVYWYLNKIKTRWISRALELDLYTEDDMRRLAQQEAERKRQAEERERRDAERLVQEREKKEREKEEERKAQEESRAYKEYIESIPHDLLRDLFDWDIIPPAETKAAVSSRASVEELRRLIHSHKSPIEVVSAAKDAG
jgi:hypothetical protein